MLDPQAVAGGRNPFLDRLRDGELTLMLGIRSSRTADVVRIAREAGYHAVMIDLEHSTMPLDVAVQLCATAGDLGLTPFVRVPGAGLRDDRAAARRRRAGHHRAPDKHG
jgi:2-keto-3-deoxy-L-rhamnonate aldolase RhmA